MTLEADRFLEDLSGKFARPYAEILSDWLVAIVRGNKIAASFARDQFNDTMRETMGASEVLGATLTLQAAAGELKDDPGARFSRALLSRQLLRFAAEPVQKILPRVSLTEAIEDMVERTPVTLRRAAERTAQRISELYGEGANIAFVRSAEAAVTKRAQSLITEALQEGIGEAGGARAVRLGVNEIRKRTAAWTEGYSRMAFRTNVNTAVTAGRFRQVQDPDVRAVIPAFRYETAGDVDVRDNHKADGLIFRVDNTVWAKLAPPLGYSCRCRVSFVSVPMLKRMNRIRPDGTVIESRLPASVHPDPGFRHGGRPDLFLLGAVR